MSQSHVRVKIGFILIYLRFHPSFTELLRIMKSRQFLKIFWSTEFSMNPFVYQNFEGYPEVNFC